MLYHTTFVDDKDIIVWQIKSEHVFLWKPIKGSSFIIG